MDNEAGEHVIIVDKIDLLSKRATIRDPAHGWMIDIDTATLLQSMDTEGREWLHIVPQKSSVSNDLDVFRNPAATQNTFKEEYYEFDQQSIMPKGEVGQCFGLSAIMAHALASGDMSNALNYLANLKLIGDNLKSVHNTDTAGNTSVTDPKVTWWGKAIMKLHIQMNKNTKVGHKLYHNRSAEVFSALKKKEGVYYLLTHNHVMVIAVKRYNDVLTYSFFDPNRGLITNTNFEQFESTVAKHFNKHRFLKEPDNLFHGTQILGAITRGESCMLVGIEVDAGGKIFKKKYFLVEYDATKSDYQDNVLTQNSDVKQYFDTIDDIKKAINKKETEGWDQTVKYRLINADQSHFDAVNAEYILENGKHVNLDAFYKLSVENNLPWEANQKDSPFYKKLWSALKCLVN